MDILKAFNIDNKNFEINIQGTDDDPLFQANQIGRLLGLTNVHKTLSTFDSDEKVLTLSSTLGGEQQTTFLTEIGLYRLLGMSRKPIAHTFQKWVYNVVKEIRKNGKYELQKQHEVDKQLYEKRIALERHIVILNAYAKKDVVYLTKLKAFDDDKDIIKLGWTDDIEERQRALKTQFGGSMFQNVFEVNQNQKFELFLKRNKFIMSHAYRDDIIPDVKSTETYLMNKEDYKSLLKIIKRNINNFRGFNPEQYIENEKLKLENKRCDLQLRMLDMMKTNPEYINQLSISKIGQLDIANNVIDTVDKNIENRVDDEVDENHDEDTDEDTDEDSEEETESKTEQTLPRRNTRQRKVQQYTPDTLQLIKTFEGLMDTIRTYPTFSKFGVKNAALKNTIYNGFRWYFIDPSSEYKQYDIPETVQIHTSIPKYIARLNKEKTLIEIVSVSQQAAAESINIKRKTTIHDAIHKGNLVQNQYYFTYFDDCDEALRNEFLSRSELPNLIVPKGTKIQQIDLKSNKIIKTFNSISDVLKEVCISRASLKRACTNNEAYKGFAWKMVE